MRAFAPGGIWSVKSRSTGAVPQPGIWNDPIRVRQPHSAVVARYSPATQNRQSSAGSTFSDE